MKTFSLHPQLQEDCIFIRQVGICQLLLHGNALFPWFILVPEVTEAQLHLLAKEEREQLYEAVQLVSECVERHYQPTRMNVGALGNLVPQLHVHVVARYKQDPAWPGPVWGFTQKKPYQPQAIEDIGRLFAMIPR